MGSCDDCGNRHETTGCRVPALLRALGPVVPSDQDLRFLRWLAAQDGPTVEAFCRLLTAARASVTDRLAGLQGELDRLEQAWQQHGSSYARGRAEAHAHAAGRLREVRGG